MMIALAAAIALATAMPGQTASPSPSTPSPSTAGIAAARAAIAAGRPQEALDTLAPVIAANAAARAADRRRSYCGMSMTETLLYMTFAAKEKRDAVALGPDHCEALYLRGFALIDLGRVAEAKAAYEEALALAPMHAAYLIELGQTYRLAKDWPRMLDLCRQAEGYAGFANKGEETTVRGAALRCQGYALIEQGKLDAAAALYRQCLALDPNDAKARNELQYITEQRAKPTA